jgi:hypothetical protein
VESQRASAAQEAKLARMDKRVDEVMRDVNMNGERFASLSTSSSYAAVRAGKDDADVGMGQPYPGRGQTEYEGELVSYKSTFDVSRQWWDLETDDGRGMLIRSRPWAPSENVSWVQGPTDEMPQAMVFNARPPTEAEMLVLNRECVVIPPASPLQSRGPAFVARDMKAEAAAGSRWEKNENNLRMATDGIFVAVPMALTREFGGDERQIAQAGDLGQSALDAYAARSGYGRQSSVGYRPAGASRVAITMPRNAGSRPISSLEVSAPGGANSERTIQTISERIAAGHSVPAWAREQPDAYHFDSVSGRYRLNPEPVPDFSQGIGGREIPCFAAGMPVLTPNGLQSIETLSIGDLVVSWDESLDRIVNNRVIALHRNKAVDWIEIIADGQKIVSTKKHRFWESVRREWVEARYIELGMKLTTSDSSILSVDSVSVISTIEKETFNLTVENAHTYFVGSGNVLVHNDGNGVNGKVYLGINSAGQPIYVGQTVQTLAARQTQHQAEALIDSAKWGWKGQMKLELYPGLDGLTPDQMDFHERRIFDQLKSSGFDLKNSQIPLTDTKINSLLNKYC